MTAWTTQIWVSSGVPAVWSLLNWCLRSWGLTGVQGSRTHGIQGEVWLAPPTWSSLSTVCVAVTLLPTSAPPVLPLLLSPRHPSSIFFPKHSSNCLTALVPTSVEPTHLLEQVQSPQPSLPSHLTSCQPHPPHLPSQNLSSASCICCPPSQAEHLLAHSSSRHFSLLPCRSLLYSPSLDRIFPLT